MTPDEYCRRLARGHYENFTVASPFVPSALRLDLIRFYAFCRTTDDFGDESGSRAAALEALDRWRAETETLFEGALPTHPVLLALRETVARHNLPSKPFFDLIEANVADQRIFEYKSWPQLEAYCMLSAAPVGRVVLRLFDMESADTQRLSDDVCIGLQLANHAQDVTRDAALRRRYLLQEDIDAGGVRAAVRSLVRRARTMLASGKHLEHMAPGVLRVQLALYRLGGNAICDAIERVGYRTDVLRPSVSNARKVTILIRALAAAAQRRSEVRDAKTA